MSQDQVSAGGSWRNPGEREYRVEGPITKAVERVGRWDWRVAYKGTLETGVPVLIMPGPRYWFRRTAERALRRSGVESALVAWPTPDP